MKDLDTLIDAACKVYPKAKRIAVENFCVSADNYKFANAINLKEDARAYKWNTDTVIVIKQVLRQTGKL